MHSITSRLSPREMVGMDADLTAVAAIIAPFSANEEAREQYSPFQFTRGGDEFTSPLVTTLPESSEVGLVAPGVSGDVRQAHRVFAKQLPDDVRRGFYEERARLVRLETEAGLRPDQARRLRMVEWQLDRIEDAYAGESLDCFARAVDAQERFAKDVALLVGALDARIGGRKPRSTRGHR